MLTLEHHVLFGFTVAVGVGEPRLSANCHLGAQISVLDRIRPRTPTWTVPAGPQTAGESPGVLWIARGRWSPARTVHGRRQANPAPDAFRSITGSLYGIYRESGIFTGAWGGAGVSLGCRDGLRAPRREKPVFWVIINHFY